MGLRWTSPLLLLGLLGTAVAQKHCQKPQTKSELREGVTFAFASPIARVPLVAADSPELAAVREAIERKYNSWNAESECPIAGEFVSEVDDNDFFFFQQMRLYDAGEATFLEARNATTAAIVAAWRADWLQAVRDYLGAALGHSTRADDLGELELFVWAGVHEECKWHLRHVHDEALVAGSFYVSTPPGAGALVFDDPRGVLRWPPIQHNRIQHVPEAGELVLFPPWLTHSVQPSCGVGAKPRVVLAFDVVPAGRAANNGDWSVLGEVSHTVPPEATFLASGRPRDEYDRP